MKKILFLCLLAFALPAYALHDNSPIHYRIWLNPVIQNEETNKQNFVLQIRNRTDQPQYQVKVRLNIYIDERPGTRLMDQHICLVGRNLKEDNVWDYYMDEWWGTAEFLIPIIDPEKTFEFLVEWSEPVSIRYSSVIVDDEDGGFGVEIWPNENANNQPKHPPLEQLSLVYLYPDEPRRCSLSL